MSKLAISRQSQAGLISVLVLAIGLPAIGIMFKPSNAVQPTPSALPQATELAIAPTPTSPLRTPFPSPSATPPHPSPTSGEASCDLPANLPLAPTAFPVPQVTTRRTLLFTSFLYGKTGSVSTVRNDPQGDWAMGLWYASPTEAPRLLVAPEAGMVLPLALTADGDAVAVWWLPARRAVNETPCAAGVYIVSPGSGTSVLVATTNDVAATEQAQPTDEVTLWTDPTSGRGTTHWVYAIPRAAFAANGGFLAIVERHRIRLVGRAPDPVPIEHVGDCPIWGWAPTAATFVAGCEDATSAWYVRAGDGLLPDNIAIPFPDGAPGGPGWEASSRRAIGIAGDGSIRLARFFGVATGCESDPCTIPPSGYSITAIDPQTRVATHRTGSAAFQSGSAEPNSPVRFAAGAAWLYTDVDARGARTFDLGSGKFFTALPVGASAGVAADGSVVFGTFDDLSRLRALVNSVNASGTRVAEALITWPDRTLAPASTVIPVLNLVAG